ncbi:NifB/NifX family molybdenum-iron cluster-binding protein [uncultured Lutibacter sp.]|uniref:NifB/NifX family molybdenum-iron cluster-binding protein n=1 Tax=uncultured Lutibacter sp. TaxID=437739 RepID=UPI002629327A|nr:NifB/NifX family molybdenum-iron cluster-binding protein [uncultured Lutibacter sp.]
MKKIAIPVSENNQLEDHFGQCEFYGIYTISDKNEIINAQILESEQGCGCKSNIASVLAMQGVTLMLAGGIGAGAINVLNNSGIDVLRGCSGNVTDILAQYINGQLIDSGESCLQHEHHHGDGDGHSCGH